MSFLHRFCGFCFTLATLSTVPSTASLLLFPIVLASGFRLVAYSDVAQLRWLIRAAFLTLLGSRINEWIAFLPAGYRFAWRGNTSTLWMAPCQYSLLAWHSPFNCNYPFADQLCFCVDHAVAIVRSFLLPHWLGGKLATFSSSGSINSVINERDVGARAPLMRRIKVIWWNCGVWIHVIYLLFIVGAAASSIVRSILVARGSWRDHLFYVLTHTAWPPMVWLITMAACTIPIHYSVRPPSMPDREDLLQRDKETGIAHPTKGAKRPRWGKSNLLEEFFYGLIAAYTTTLFVGTWFF